MKKIKLKYLVHYESVSRSVMSDSWNPMLTKSTIAHRAPLSTEFSRQEYWSGSLFPCLGDYLEPGMEPESSALWVDSLPPEPPRNPQVCYTFLLHIFRFF